MRRAGTRSTLDATQRLRVAEGEYDLVLLYHNDEIREQRTIEKLELEGDINVTAVWGTGDLDEAKTLGFSAVRVKIDAEGDAPQEEIDDIIKHSNVWSPVANTLRNNVKVEVTSA